MGNFLKGSRFLPLVLFFWTLSSFAYLSECRVVNRESSARRPIIGVVAQKTFGRRASHGSSYFAASYVKYLEAAGARVVPVRIDQPDEYYDDLFKKLNGVLLPGGGQDLIASGYTKAARHFFKLAKASHKNGDSFPIWGTCLGFEQLLVLVAEKNILDSCNGTSNVALPVYFYDGFKDSKMFENAPEDVLQTLEDEAVTANYHKKCLWVKTFLNHKTVKEFYNILTTNNDKSDHWHVSAIEAKDYPFYGLQWHPEKNPFEWHPALTGVVHTPSSIRVAQYFADFFVNEARKNSHGFSSREEEQNSLIYNFAPVYTGKIDDDHFEQCYFFDV